MGLNTTVYFHDYYCHHCHPSSCTSQFSNLVSLEALTSQPGHSLLTIYLNAGHMNCSWMSVIQATSSFLQREKTSILHLVLPVGVPFTTRATLAWGCNMADIHLQSAPTHCAEPLVSQEQVLFCFLHFISWSRLGPMRLYVLVRERHEYKRSRCRKIWAVWSYSWLYLLGLLRPNLKCIISIT